VWTGVGRAKAFEAFYEALFLLWGQFIARFHRCATGLRGDPHEVGKELVFVEEVALGQLVEDAVDGVSNSGFLL
jgi:hypothetical protein